MHIYRAIVHYYFKKGMEKEGMKYLENELLKAAKAAGAHDIEVWYNEKEPTHVVGMGLWNNLDEARKFQSLWGAKEKELMKYCEKAPHHEIYKVCDEFAKRFGKAA